MLQTKEAIILAGGRGTRLGHLTDHTPKPLLPINGKPFLLYLIDYLRKQGITRVVLSTGYKASQFPDALKQVQIELLFSEEKTPLGTGGGIRSAMEKIMGHRFFAINGDTYFPVSLEALEQGHLSNKAEVTLALRNLKNFDRYGTVTVQGGRITAFAEKKPVSQGLINGGIYLIEKKSLQSKPLNVPFSFEKDFLEKEAQRSKIFSETFEDYFIDLGVPEDLRRAEAESTNW